MSTIDTLFDPALLDEMIEAGYVKVQDHPSMPLRLANYTPAAQYERLWNDCTRHCRGLVFDRDTLEIVSRTLPKFWNVEEHDSGLAPFDLPWERPFTVYDKLDGSMIAVSTTAEHGLVVTSRGSFASEHAMYARAMLDEMEWAPPVGLTHIFELIAPWNRIVVNYGTRDELVLLAVVKNRNGREIPHEELDFWWPGNIVKRFDGLAENTPGELLEHGQLLEDDVEGYVLHFEDGTRAKIKAERYKRLHKLVTGLTPKKIWEALCAGDSFEDLAETVPDEFFDWLTKIVERLTGEVRSLEDAVDAAHGSVSTLDSRKEQAIVLASHPSAVRAAVFRRLDGKPYHDILWRAVKPEHHEVFAAAS